MTTDDLKIHIVRTFDAPRELVFRQWTESQLLATWFAPDGFRCTHSEAEPRAGGRWQVEYENEADGMKFTEFGEFREIDAPERLVLTLTQRDRHGKTFSETLVTVVLKALGKQTEMTFVQTGFESAARRDGNEAGWKTCLDKLARHLQTGS